MHIKVKDSGIKLKTNPVILAGLSCFLGFRLKFSVDGKNINFPTDLYKAGFFVSVDSEGQRQ